MKRIVVGCVDDIFCRTLNQFIDKEKYKVVSISKTKQELTASLKQHNPDLCIIHNSFKANDIQIFLEHITFLKKYPIIYVGNKTDLNYLYNLINDSFFYYTDEFNLRITITHSLDVIIKNVNGLIKANEEIKRLKKQNESLKVINKAKLFLIEEKGYKESEAHDYIVKNSMKYRLSKVEFSKKIINNQINVDKK